MITGFLESVYIFAQVVGGVIGAALAYGQYIHAIDIYEGGHDLRTRATASLFISYPVSRSKLMHLKAHASQIDYLSAASSFFSEFFGTAILAFVIMAVTDSANSAPSLGLVPLAIFLTLLGLSLGFGMQTCECISRFDCMTSSEIRKAFSFNPARDFGPRLFLTMAGYGNVYSYKS